MTAEPSTWSRHRRFLFRFGCLYFLIYSFPFPLNAVPWDLFPERVRAAVGKQLFERWSH